MLTYINNLHPNAPSLPEDVMQERYCTCGRKITVSFTLTPKGWTAILLPRQNDPRAATPCPACGKKLDIDALR